MVHFWSNKQVIRSKLGDDISELVLLPVGATADFLALEVEWSDAYPIGVVEYEHPVLKQVLIVDRDTYKRVILGILRMIL